MKERLQQLYERYAPMIYRRALSVLKNDEEAWDVVQEVFLRLVERNTLVERMASPTTYLWRMATNVALNRLRREGRAGDVLEEDPADARSSEDDRFRTLFLEHLFSRVSEKTRELAWYKWVDRMTWEETAEVSGMSVSGVRKNLAAFTKRVARYKEHMV